MASLELALRLAAGLLLIAANAFFVAIEFALTRVRQFPEAAFDEPGLRRAWEMTSDLELYLTSCQVCITASSIALGIVAEPALAALFEPLFGGTRLAAAGAGGLVAFLVLNLVHLTHGEQTPTYLGVERTRLVARYGARPLSWFTRLIYPAIWIGDKVAKATLRLFGIEMTKRWLETQTEAIESRAELHARLGSVLAAGDLAEDRQDEVLAALAIGERPVGDIVVPLDQAVILSTEAPQAENLRRIVESPHTRYPLVGGSPSEPKGIIYVPAAIEHFEALLAGEVELEAIAAPPMVLEAGTPIGQAIDAFQEAAQEMAMVHEDGQPVGIVTATDTLEAVVGELEDPLDREPSAA